MPHISNIFICIKVGHSQNDLSALAVKLLFQLPEIDRKKPETANRKIPDIPSRYLSGPAQTLFSNKPESEHEISTTQHAPNRYSPARSGRTCCGAKYSSPTTTAQSYLFSGGAFGHVILSEAEGAFSLVLFVPVPKHFGSEAKEK